MALNFIRAALDSKSGVWGGNAWQLGSPERLRGPRPPPRNWKGLKLTGAPRARDRARAFPGGPPQRHTRAAEGKLRSPDQGATEAQPPEGRGPGRCTQDLYKMVPSLPSA